MIRHGDILLVEASRPEGKPIIHQRRLVLAEGEATGHKHEVLAPLILEWVSSGTRHILAQDGVLTHPEHGEDVLNVTYQIIQQREYSPDASRNVKD